MNYYEILGVATDATLEQIKAVHKKLVKKYHPDTKHGDKEKFLNVQHAYDILKDPEKREHYDKTGNDYVPEEDNTLEIIATLFNALIDSDKPIENYVETIKEALQFTIKEANSQIERINKDINKFRRLQKRLKKKKGSADDTDFFFTALNSKIIKNEDRKKRAQSTVADTYKALKMMETYEDTGEPGSEEGFMSSMTIKKMYKFRS